MDATNLADLYGTPLLDWNSVKARLDEGLSQAPDTGGPNRHTCWLATINGDGSPHVTGIGALWSTTPSGSKPARGLERGGTSGATLAAR